MDMRIKRFTEKGYHGELGFFCPGCKTMHYINDDETNKSNEAHYKYLKEHNLKLPDTWTFNKDYELPTVRASVLVYNNEMRCHSFITDGKIQYLWDCTHDLKGKTVVLPIINDNML